MTDFYRLLEDREKSERDFIDFIYFMVDNAHQRMDDKLQADFMYHFKKMPSYIMAYLDRMTDKVKEAYEGRR